MRKLNENSGSCEGCEGSCEIRQARKGHWHRKSGDDVPEKNVFGCADTFSHTIIAKV